MGNVRVQENVMPQFFGISNSYRRHRTQRPNGAHEQSGLPPVRVR